MAKTLTAEAPAPNLVSTPESPAPLFQTITLGVDNMHCGGCMRSVEQALTNLTDVNSARVNLSERRVVVRADSALEPEYLIATLKDAGFSASLLAEFSDASQENLTADLTRRLGVAGFAAMNVMLLSVSVWSGGEGDMAPSVQSLFHWLSALIALPAIVYSGQPFFKSARMALMSWRVNMDVPISIGVLLATALSLYQTATGSGHVYFDAAIMLLTFLLLGRLLDQLMRQRAMSAAENLLKLRQPSVRVVADNGESRRILVGRVVPGMRVLVPAGERLAVDGRIVEGTSNVDQSIITGETLPLPVAKGDTVFAGAINLLQPLIVQVTAREDQSLLCEIAALMATAEQQRGHYVRIADRAAKAYAPMVHALAAVTFVAWLAAGASWQIALPIAISVLIITCPCAIALAVPAVQVAAAGRLMKRGIILKSSDALERLAQCDMFVFDKTGTLTHGTISLRNGDDIDDATLTKAASMAANSTHLYSQAIVDAAKQRGLTVSPAPDVKEAPGFGLVAGEGIHEHRLGSAKWCGIDDDATNNGVYFVSGGRLRARFQFQDRMKDDAAQVIDSLRKSGLGIELLSGDASDAVSSVSRSAGISVFSANVTPAQKVERLRQLRASGHTVAMVGDGLNDAPSLTAAHVSLSPASAAHISQSAADFVFQGERLAPVIFALETANKAHRLVRQNFALAIGYNLIFVPLAMAGLVTPLIAAIAMSVSSISVTANAVRLRARKSEVSP